MSWEVTAEMRNAKIIARIFGGLGNQLFGYAAARRLAAVNDAELVVDDVSGFEFDEQYRRRYELHHFHVACRRATERERMEPFSCLRRRLHRIYSGIRPFDQRSYIFQRGVDFDPRLLALRTSSTVYLDGYWQSEGYFSDIETILRNELRIRTPLDRINQEVVERIHSCNAAAVHVRFFDRPGEDEHYNASIAYYAAAVNLLDSLEPDLRYFVFSDRPKDARSRLPLPDNRIELVTCNSENAAYADLWLMSQCRHFIIANSTFSWWGAWLSQANSKRVIAPGMKLRGKMSWGFEGLLPDSWIAL